MNITRPLKLIKVDLNETFLICTVYTVNNCVQNVYYYYNNTHINLKWHNQFHINSRFKFKEHIALIFFFCV